jgi:hypothetical protein
MAIISLGLLCLSTTLLHVYLNSSLRTAAYEQVDGKSILAFPILGGLAILWKNGMNQWVLQLYEISPLVRNNSMIGGLAAWSLALI